MSRRVVTLYCWSVGGFREGGVFLSVEDAEDNKPETPRFASDPVLMTRQIIEETTDWVRADGLEGMRLFG